MSLSLTLQDMQIMFLNFAGAEGPYNRAGDRNFSVKLNPEQAQGMLADGWNVKFIRPRKDADPDEPRQAHLPVDVEYRKGRPPKITLVTWNGKTPLDEETVDLIDIVDIDSVDIILNGYQWAVNGNSGIKAYLKTLYVVVREDELDKKYRYLDELPTVSGRMIESGPGYIEGELVPDRLEIEA